MSEGLPRVDASGFRQRISTIPLALVLMCIPSDDVCADLDLQLSQVRATLRAERSPFALRLLDVSGEAGAALRARYAHGSPAPLYVFRRGVATPYVGPPHSVDLLMHLRKLAAQEDEKGNEPSREPPPASVSPSAESGRPPPSQEEPQLQHVQEAKGPTGGTEPDSMADLPEPALLPLTRAGFEEALEAHPLMLALFFDRHRRPGRNFLLSNFSAAAEVLAAQSVEIKLGWMQVSANGEGHTALRLRYDVGEMPAVKLFNRGKAYDYQAPADMASLVDVARWNAGAHALGTAASGMVEVEGPLAMRQLLSATPPRLVLVSFTTSWCTRCLANLPLLAEVSRLFGVHGAAITVAVVNIDDPLNQPLVEQHEILAFPQQKVFWRGHVALQDFAIRSGAGAAREIAEELNALRQHLVTMDVS